MKILLAYDGSSGAQAAVDDLLQAGLPLKAQVRVVAVTESWMPPPSSLELLAGRERESEAFIQARDAAVAIRTTFPEWEVTPQSQFGSPGNILLEIADHWKPDLIVVGSHGHTAIGRFFLGSVSQKIVTAAHCSVRVARGRIEEPETPLRLIVGMDGSAGATAAVDAVVRRNWPAGTEIRLINASWNLPLMGPEDATAALAEWVAEAKQQLEEKMIEATQQLQARGLQISQVIKQEDPKHLLCDEAEKWGADCIFVGAQGISKIERLLLGSVSASVAARAHCSVEVVRQT